MRIILRRVAVLALVFVSFALTSACGAQDWIYDELPDPYEIWRINSKNISLCSNSNHDGTAKVIVGPYISLFAYNNNFIFLQQISALDNSEISDDLTPNYYLLAVDGGELYGPMSQTDFDTTCTDLGIEELPPWIDTADISS